MSCLPTPWQLILKSWIYLGSPILIQGVHWQTLTSRDLQVRCHCPCCVMPSLATVISPAPNSHAHHPWLGSTPIRLHGKGRVGEIASSLLNDNCSYPSRTGEFSVTKKLIVYLHSKSPFCSLQNPVICQVSICWGIWKCSFKLSFQFQSQFHGAFILEGPWDT